MLQELVNIFDWQVDNARILLLQNPVVAVVLHLQVELLSFELDGFDGRDLWDDKLEEIILTEHLHIIITAIHKAVTSLRALNSQVCLLIVHYLLAPWHIWSILSLFNVFDGFYKTADLRNVCL